MKTETLKNYYLKYYGELCPHEPVWVHEQLAEERVKLERQGQIAKTPEEINKMIADTRKWIIDAEARAIESRTILRPEVKSYREGAIWVLEWVLGKHG